MKLFVYLLSLVAFVSAAVSVGGSVGALGTAGSVRSVVLMNTPDLEVLLRDTSGTAMHAAGFKYEGGSLAAFAHDEGTDKLNGPLYTTPDGVSVMLEGATDCNTGSEFSFTVSYDGASGTFTGSQIFAGDCTNPEHASMDVVANIEQFNANVFGQFVVINLPAPFAVGGRRSVVLRKMTDYFELIQAHTGFNFISGAYTTVGFASNSEFFLYTETSFGNEAMCFINHDDMTNTVSCLLKSAIESEFGSFPFDVSFVSESSVVLTDSSNTIFVKNSGSSSANFLTGVEKKFEWSVVSKTSGNFVRVPVSTGVVVLGMQDDCLESILSGRFDTSSADFLQYTCTWHTNVLVNGEYFVANKYRAVFFEETGEVLDYHDCSALYSSLSSHGIPYGIDETDFTCYDCSKTWTSGADTCGCTFDGAAFSTICSSDPAAVGLGASDSEPGVWFPCPVGFACETPGSMTKCGDAEYSSAVKSTSCAPCAQGTSDLNFLGTAISAYDGSTVNVACYSQPCPDGFVCDSGAPVACPPGTAGSGGACDACTDNKFSLGAALVCSVCPSNSKSNDGIRCLCDAGYYRDPETATCIQVPIDTTSADFTEVYTPCPAGQYTDAAGSLTCNTCAVAGTEFLRDGVTDACVCSDAGKYFNSDSGACEATLSGYFSPALDSSAYKCAPNTFSGLGFEKCVACPLHSQGTDDRTSCVCDAGYYTDALVCMETPAGYYSPSGSNDKIACDGSIGEYSDAGAEACSECPVNTFVQVGATACVTCPASAFCDGTSTTALCSDLTGNRYCKMVSGANTDAKCPAGSYISDDRLECLKCPIGSFCPGDGESHKCLHSSEYSDETGLSECKICVGINNDDRTECTPCGAGEVPNADRTECKSCLANQYWSTACVDCNTLSGNEVCLEGAKLTCQPGTYPADVATRLGGCLECPAGYKCDGYGSPSLCTDGTFAPAKSDTCYDCATGTASTPDRTSCHPIAGYYGIPYTMDNLGDTYNQCPEGTYCPGGSREPIPCVAGKFATVGQSSCTECAMQHKCPLKSDGSATEDILCDWADNYYQLLTGKDVCTRCNGVLADCLKSDVPACGVGEAPCADCDAGKYFDTDSAGCKLCSELTGSQYCDAVYGYMICPMESYVSGEGRNVCTACSQIRVVEGSTKFCERTVLSDGVYNAIAECPYGSYITEDNKGCVACESGQYCDASANMIECNLLGGTEYCKSTTERAFCAEGYYIADSNRTTCVKVLSDEFAYGTSDAPLKCNTLTDDQYCSNGAVRTCPAGSYVSDDRLSCSECPADEANAYCYGGQKLTCDTEYYVTEDRSECLACPGSYVCLGDGQARACPTNADCSNSTMTTCALGFYISDAATLTCTECEIDFYCDGKISTACPDGTHSTGRASAESQCAAPVASNVGSTVGIAGCLAIVCLAASMLLMWKIRKPKNAAESAAATEGMMNEMF